MKNRTNFLGIIALVTIIGFVGVSCGSDGDDFNAANPTIPPLPVGDLQANPEHFFMTGAVAGRFPAPSTAIQQQQVADFLVAQITSQRDLLNAFMFAETYVGRPVGGPVDFSELSEAQLTALGTVAPRILRGADDILAGTVTSVFNATDFFRGATTSGAATISTSPAVRFQFGPLAVVNTENEIPPTGTLLVPTGRAFGVVAVNVNSRMDWNQNREWGTNNDGYNAIVGFVMRTVNAAGEATVDADDNPTGVSGFARVRWGQASRFDGGRDSLDTLPQHGTESDPAISRERAGTSTVFQIEFINRDGTIAAPLAARVDVPGASLGTLPERYTPWARSVNINWDFVSLPLP